VTGITDTIVTRLDRRGTELRDLSAHVDLNLGDLRDRLAEIDEQAEKLEGRLDETDARLSGSSTASTS
jgi:chromosome segregation ATPase